MPSSSLVPPLRPSSSSSSSSAAVAQRIIHALNTCTSPSELRRALSLLLVRRLVPPSPSVRFTFPLLLSALSEPRHGLMVHTHVVKSGFGRDLFVRNSLLRLYCCREGDMAAAHQLFDEMPQRDVVAWTTLITGYKNCGRPDDAIARFSLLMELSASGAAPAPNRVTMVGALGACAARGAVDVGARIHDYVRARRWELDVVLGTALVDMYAKCGAAEAALAVFGAMPERSAGTWNALIVGLARARGGAEALRWFARMEEEEEEEGEAAPDAATITAVLSACAHSGLVDAGVAIFGRAARGGYAFGAPTVRHYGCVVDMLGRAGRVAEAAAVVRAMPCAPSAAVWGALLGACRACGGMRRRRGGRLGCRGGGRTPRGALLLQTLMMQMPTRMMFGASPPPRAPWSLTWTRCRM
ncbi:pentatricopeptide repeat-containing protein At5g66520-like [Ananas comosus]|uniref:Pentatricopeptide repeat-containing protein At5g66520-like n=1 Tax=Ananas comosus TaxID=4615 RepID=A0A6P5ELB1_ANACO|nr:pentatricopeptide repeat-containing protein At5g66520-like [Ananas comosus]